MKQFEPGDMVEPILEHRDQRYAWKGSVQLLEVLEHPRPAESLSEEVKHQVVSGVSYYRRCNVHVVPPAGVLCVVLEGEVVYTGRQCLEEELFLTKGNTTTISPGSVVWVNAHTIRKVGDEDRGAQPTSCSLRRVLALRRSTSIKRGNCNEL